jgi:hypothetical protein
MNLQSDIWKDLEGGYKVPYDASVPLRKLHSSNDEAEIKKIFAELWDELHHQGDVGTASYYSVPVLVEICIEKKSIDWNYIGICLNIEHCRLKGDNPSLPKELEREYFESLKKFEEYLLINFTEIKKDNLSLLLTLSFLATVNGHPNLGRAISLLEDNDVLTELLSQY